jgi:hypothetical protein
LADSFLVLIDDRPLEKFFLENCPDRKEFKTLPFLVSSGGHQIRFLFGKGLERLPVESIRLCGHPAGYDELTESFPFDLYQRYAAFREIIPLLYPSSAEKVRILDYGGVMGGSLGHMGSIADFLPSYEVTLADTRACDLPHFVRLEEGAFPFHARQFSTVVCLDVLEHIPAAERKAFILKLLETASDWLILGCPFADEAVADAEDALDAFIQNQLGYRHSFLAEHSLYGLPVLAEIHGILQEAGVRFATLPNGYLPRWFFMQCVSFFVSSLQCDHLAERINRFYNRYFFPVDKQGPAYRQILVIDAGNSGRLEQLSLERLTISENQQPPPHWTDLGHLLLELLNLNRVGVVQKEAERLSFLLSSREQLLLQQQIHQRMLEEQMGFLKGQNGSLEKERLDLQRHITNLEAHIRGLEDHIRGLEAHARGLEEYVRCLEKHNQELTAGMHRLELEMVPTATERRRLQEVSANLEHQVETLRCQLDSPTLKVMFRVAWKMVRKHFRSPK